MREGGKRASVSVTPGSVRSSASAPSSTASFSSTGTANGSRSTGLAQSPRAAGSGASGTGSGPRAAPRPPRAPASSAASASRRSAAAHGGEAPGAAHAHADADALALVGDDLVERAVAGRQPLDPRTHEARVGVAGARLRGVDQIREQVSHRASLPAVRRAYACFTAEMSRLMVTFSPTRRLPLPRAWLKVMFQSPRLILPVTSSPTRSLPHGSVSVPSTTAVSVHRVGHAVHRELDLDLEGVLVERTDRGGLEAQLRVLVGAEKVGRAKVLVATGVARVDGARLGRAVCASRGEVRADLERALELLELAPNRCDAEVLHGEADGRVRSVDGPGAVRDESRSCCGNHVAPSRKYLQVQLSHRWAGPPMAESGASMYLSYVSGAHESE